eukprot:3703477-Amphidinium_carterae.2
MERMHRYSPFLLVGLASGCPRVRCAGYMESIAIGKNLAAKNGYEIEAGQDIVTALKRVSAGRIYT